MEFRILGPLDVLAGGRQVHVSGARERALLAILLIHAGEVVSADRLIDELWGSDLPAHPANALQVVVSRVRRALEVPDEAGRLVTRRPGYVLQVEPGEVDARGFGSLVEQARQAGPADQARLLGEALGLWRGPALAEFAAENFARDEAARLEEARVRAVELKADAELALGRPAELAGELMTLVAGHPLRERLRGQLMLALYRSGRQGEALRVFAEGRRVLAEELGVEPGPELQELHQQILVQAASLAAAPPVPATAPRNNLPAPVMSFVGRQAELAAARTLLASSRLVTLTGAGGCGKTRLALEVARALLGSFPDGAWLAELETVPEPAAVPQALAAAVGIRESASLGGAGESSRPLADKLTDYLRGKELLIVLDNCEHLLAQSDAVRLFVDRATAVQPAFVLDVAAAPAVGHICRRLDGIPLALELAAARVRILPAPEIAARLDDRFSLLTTGSPQALPRHRTLQAAVDWSYELASGPEQELFARLSVFAGGFTLEAAEDVCGDGGSDVLELLSHLVDQSLVIPGTGGNARFRMLETLRRYAAERLTESGAAEGLHRRHAEYFLRLAERAEPLLRGPQQAVWLRRLETEHDNAGAAIDWARRHDPEVAVRLSSALAYFWLIGRHSSEVRRRLAEAVDAARDALPASRARALVWAAQLANVEGRPDQAAIQAQEAYQLSLDAGDPRWVAMSEMILGLALGHHGELGRAGELLEAARARFAGIGDEWGEALATMLSGLVSVLAARYDQAAGLARRGLDGFRSAGDQWGQTMALELLGVLARRRGGYAEAVAAFEEALGVVRDLGLRDEVPFLLVDLGGLYILLEDFEAAAVLHAEALDLARERGARDAAAHAQNGLAYEARRQGDDERARDLHQAALSFYREAGFAAETARTLVSLGYVEELRGDLDAAGVCHRESLRLARDLPDELPLAMALEGLARVAVARRQPGRAAVLLGAAESIRTRAGTPLAPQERAGVERAAEAAISALGAEDATAELERGGRMSTREAAAYASLENGA